MHQGMALLALPQFMLEPGTHVPLQLELPVRGDILARARPLESRMGLRSRPSLRLQGGKFQEQGEFWAQKGISGLS